MQRAETMRKKIQIIVLLLAIICGITGISKLLQERQAGKEYDDLRSLARQTELVSEEATERMTEVLLTEAVMTEALTEETEPPVEIPIDFAALQQENPDIYAWIQVEGTDVDYPIVQHAEDNAFYLNHSVTGEEAIEGAIYTEDYNSLDFEDPNTVIYGHNMKNGTMFRTLHNFEDRDFFDEHRDVTIYLPDEIRHYEIFAAYLYDSRHILQTYDFSDERIFERYLDEILAIRDMSSFIDSSAELDKDSRIITLSTCYKGMKDKRYLVQAVLVSIEK